MFGSLFRKDTNCVNEVNIFDLRDKYILNNYSMNVLVLGGTGSGKTATVLLPILNSIVKYKHPTLDKDNQIFLIQMYKNITLRFNLIQSI